AVLRIGHIAAMTVRIAEMFVAAVDTVELVSRSVVAEHIAAVVSEPQLVAVRLPVETDRVANAAGLRAPVAAVGVHAEQAGERGWRIAAVARRAYGHVQAPVRAESDEAPAVVSPGRQLVRHHLRRG